MDYPVRLKAYSERTVDSDGNVVNSYSFNEINTY